MKNHMACYIMFTTSYNVSLKYLFMRLYSLAVSFFKMEINNFDLFFFGFVSVSSSIGQCS